MNNDRNILADLVFPNIDKDIAYYEKFYSPRKEKNACVTRFAPSPTGYMHIGGLYISLINQAFASQQDGTFFLRIEDTDQSRILKNGVTEIIKTLNDFDISFDEGPINETQDYGNFGPYRQSARKEIYQAFAKQLIIEGKAYPCFCSKEELEEIRENQTKSSSSVIGYSGKYAKCRHLSVSEAIEKVKRGEKFVVRLKSPVTEVERITVKDVVRGEIEMDANNIDVVLIKGDGLPTYHFAHIVDDHLMGTTHVIRGDEWIASLPLHVQMFDYLGFVAPAYAHVCPISKIEGTSKRKLSKRKDPEARVGFYFEQGYPTVAVKEYLLTLINSRFEIWREENPDKSYKEYNVSLDEMSKSGALFDIMKLSHISKTIIKNMSDEEVFEEIRNWAKFYSQKLTQFIEKNPSRFKSSISIWHKNRMDISKWDTIESQYDYLYDEDFASKLSSFESEYQAMPHFAEILNDYLDSYDAKDDSSVWFEKIRNIATKYNYAAKPKDYKKNPELYNGSVVEVSTFVRLALTARKDSPDIYEISQYLGEEEVRKRTKILISLAK